MLSLARYAPVVIYYAFVLQKKAFRGINILIIVVTTSLSHRKNDLSYSISTAIYLGDTIIRFFPYILYVTHS